MLDIKYTYKDRSTTIWVREWKKIINCYNKQCETNEVVQDMAHKPSQRRPVDQACQHLETMRQGRPANRWIRRVNTWRPCDKGDQPIGGSGVSTLGDHATRETSQSVERRPEQIQDRHDLALRWLMMFLGSTDVEVLDFLNWHNIT